MPGIPLPPRPGRSVAPPKVPSPDQRVGNYNTIVQTFITQPGVTAILYSADKPWTKVRVMLETAGPVSVGTKQAIDPVLSGKGILLTTLQPVEFTLPAGSRLYVLSSTFNRIQLVVQPLPWLEQILGGVVTGFDLLLKRLGRSSP